MTSYLIRRLGIAVVTLVLITFLVYGLIRAIRALRPAKLYFLDERHKTQPWGLYGGRAAQPNDAWLVRADGDLIKLPSKFDDLKLDPGDMFVMRTGGGGGWGDPIERDPALVLRDVRVGLLTVEQAREFFDALPAVARKLQTLVDVGLSYIQLGQSATTLSGGEAQRVKLAAELSKIATGKTLYILDEPTTGLHFADIEKLLEVLQRLVDQGNTVVVIEHNLDVVKSADWVVDLGPEGGDEGGRVVATGTPEDLAALGDGSHTGRFLRRVLDDGAAPAV